MSLLAATLLLPAWAPQPTQRPAVAAQCPGRASPPAEYAARAHRLHAVRLSEEGASSEDLFSQLQNRMSDTDQEERTTFDHEEILQVSRAWALIFNPRTENEGIYSRQMRSDFGNIECVLAFEELDDAQRYIEMLSAQNFPEATAVELRTDELLDFCTSGGYEMELVYRDALVLPPEDNADQFEWSPGVSAEGAQRLKEGIDPALQQQMQALESIFAAGDAGVDKTEGGTAGPDEDEGE